MSKPDSKTNTLASLGEFGLIRRLTEGGVRMLPHGVLGPGDDCAILPLELFREGSAGNLLVTTDTLVEDRHFRPADTSPYDLGWKTLAVSLSDIAAMGGRPKAAFLSLQIRQEIELDWLEEFYRGLYAAAGESVVIAGGDTTRGRELAFTSTVLGSCPARPLVRSGAKVGDDVWVSGEIGLAWLGLESTEGRYKGSVSPDVRQRALSRLHRPIPRSDLGAFLGDEGLANSAIDISDGLIQDISHIALASGVTVELETSSLPLPCPCSQEDVARMISGGDDYELVFTAPLSARGPIEKLSGKGTEFRVTRLGRVVEKIDSSVVLLNGEKHISAAEYFDSFGLPHAGGFDHFRK